jgi:histone chaperone ASF1
MVGPVPVGVNSFEFEVCPFSPRAQLVVLNVLTRRFRPSGNFVLQAASPSLSQIPPNDLIGVTVVLLTASYKDQEFVRIGYYVHTEYDSEELRALEEDKRPDPPQVDRLVRNVLADKPRVTRLNIQW